MLVQTTLQVTNLPPIVWKPGVKGQLVARFLSQELGMDLFVSKPD